MDATEKLVADHLAHRGYTNVVYEPDGNIPPDFLVDGNIAIEVRRLNQNHFEGGDAQGLEEVAIPLWKRVKELAGSLGAPTENESWFVFFRFTRPVEAWKTLGPKLRKALETFVASPIKQKSTVFITKGFELEVFRASNPHASMFVMGGCSDEESGGWLLSEMETNIRHCASEKSRKIKKVRSKYKHWWLALVDHIGHGLDDFDREMFRDQVSISHDWEKIILIDPRDHSRWFEL
ncbi:hypothetical protein [Quatrionicoccus australiensis]|uniref:hypothetical protein n=1 Tax=Quatrionicoccus australiensis TaxID=138118 RepID=UPI001CF90E94|nr:hypothetical protein [Quatrionicoccus australiensis]UCV13334.1 hypothetical protein KI612_10110 [Quatrionicoccus australiensis]